MPTYAGDTPLIKYDCNEDITDLSTTPLICYEKPDGTTGEWAGTIVDSNFVQYQAVAGDLVVADVGRWKIHPNLTDGGAKFFFGDIRTLVVETPVKTVSRA